MKNLSASAPLGLKKYPAYKDSRVYWIQNVPSHWESKRLKFLAKLINNKNEACTDLQYVGLENIESWTGKLLESESIPEGVSNLFEADDVLFGKLRPYLAKVMHAKKAGTCTSEALVLRSNTLHPHYLYYYLFSKDFIAVVDSSTYGSKMPRASWDFIGNQPALIPSYAEQRSIASFLDRKTTEIDALIAKKRRMIELLQEKRTAVISHAVTKGLDPNAPMKDSGVEWMGKVPRHWEVKKIKRLCLVKRGASPRPIDDPKYFDDDGEYAWVRIADVTASERYLETTTQRLSELGKSLSVPLQPGELFLSIAGSVGKPIITKIKCCIHDGFVYFFGLKQNQEFLYYIFASGQPYLGLGKMGTQLNLNTDTVGDIKIGLPDLDEQHKIVDFLDRETNKFDNLIKKIQEAIDKLIEYRTALISAAVTGKIDVRNEAA